MSNKLKEYPTIGCCGIDCALCPRYYTKGDSACPGCGGLSFSEKHPSCGILTCCVIKHGFEVCSECNDYPCKRFDAEKDGYDSFVTHKKVFTNLGFIKENGIEQFIENQKIRIDILKDLLTHYDDGRSKSFYCLSCALLPVEKLQEILAFAYNLNDEFEQKVKVKLIKITTTEIAASVKLELKLNNRK
jgi:hypothetical protein